ncbi:MAG: 2-oxoglutarate dehydrogenase complex dihydrolipoyllysine-residue succinyltransferase [Gemmatimonadota bacterium]|nr:2-oxoglutarate dehydrogenase complex dihydrolipoyllysine-residue succinyltransferase [Gemmatimonadota bacterium]
MISIKVPPLGESIVEATVTRWLKAEGEAVAQGETLVELETDKVTVEVPAFKAGVLAKRLVGEGDVVKVEQELGQVDETAAGAVAEPAGVTGGRGDAAVGSEQVTSAPEPARGDASAAGVIAPGSPKTSPAVRRIAAEKAVDVSQVAGTGRGGRVTKGDIVTVVEGRERGSTGRGGTSATSGPSPAAQSSSAPPGQPLPSAAPGIPRPRRDGQRETREKMSTRRRRIAEHLLEAQHATAHLTTFNEVDMSAVEGLRARLKERVEKDHGVRLTFMPFYVKAACMALEAYPVVNAQVDGDSIIYKHYVNMGIAVASDQGLVVPVVRDADAKGLLDIGRDISAVAKRARDGKLTMDDLTGGTFTITNGGVFGSLLSTPIINYPQVGILGLHKIQDRPIAVAGRIEIRPIMYVALSYDHRIVDGQQAVLFLVRIKELMEDPGGMLVG